MDIPPIGDIPWPQAAKFAPGYLSFFYVLGHAGYKLRVRSHHRAIGPADELRQCLEEARRGLESIAVGGASASWFMADEQRHMSQHLSDLSLRFRNKSLRAHVLDCARAWEDAAASTLPHSHSPMGWFVDGNQTESDRQRLEQESRRFAAQQQHGREGVAAANEALARLSKLELKTRGW